MTMWIYVCYVWASIPRKDRCKRNGSFPGLFLEMTVNNEIDIVYAL
jgi:hypothetical protein